MSTRQNWIALFLISILYVLYANFVLVPSHYKSFSLIDDGQTIQNNIHFNNCIENRYCNDLYKVLIEKEFGRFRPIYWAVNYIQYSITGLNPALIHEFRIFIVGLLLIVLLSIFILLAGGGVVGVFVAGIYFMTSFSFTENIVRLGPAEPYQLLFMCIFLLTMKLPYKISHVMSYTFFILASLTKETSFLICLPLIINSLIFKTDYREKLRGMFYLIIGIMIFVIGRVVSKPLPGQLAYIENFQINQATLVENSIHYFNLATNLTSPFMKIVILLLFVSIAIPKMRSLIVNKQSSFWILNFALFILVLVPWKYVLERYLFVSLFSFSVFIGLVSSSIHRFVLSQNIFSKSKLRRNVLIAILILIYSNILVDSSAVSLAKTLNYREWYSTYLEFEQDQVQAVVRSNSKEVYINAKDNIDNWEVLFEIPIHLRYIYDNSTKLTRIDTIPEGGIILSRSSMIQSFSDLEIIEREYEIVSSQGYLIRQFDPLVFKRDFKLRPLSTLLSQNSKNSYITYSWTIYQK